MATKLPTFDFSTPSALTTADKAVYPWDEWFDGDIWELTEGEDFQGHPLMMERIIRTRATGKRAKVSLRHVALNGEPWGKIVLQRTDITGPNEAKRTAKREKAAATRAANAAAKNGTKPNGKAPAKKVAAKTTVAKRATAKMAAPVTPAKPTKRATKRPVAA